MIEYCKRCKSKITIPDLTEEEKLVIWGLNNEGLQSISWLMSNKNLSVREGKGLKIHINKRYGYCIRCKKTDLIGENVECPKCKGFNLNWKINLSFNEDFCQHLEFRLSESLKLLEETKGFWCDGISWQPKDLKQLSKKSVNDTRKIITDAWLGQNGQEKYKMTIRFGKQALSRFAKEKNLLDCIPNSTPNEWIEVDTSMMEIIIKLK